MQTVVELKRAQKIDEETVAAFVVLENKKVFDNVDLFYQKTFLGASLKQIAENVVRNYNYTTITINEGDYQAAFSHIALACKKAETIVVVFADACVIEDNLLSHAINQAEELGVVNLNKSFVCTKKYFKNATLNKIMETPIFNYAKENIIIDNNTYISDLEFAFQNVIIHNFVKKGVKFLSLTDVKIDFSAKISSGTILGAGTTIINNSVVERDCFIEHSTIKSSVIGKECKITDVVLDNAEINAGHTIAGIKGADASTIKQVTIN